MDHLKKWLKSNLYQIYHFDILHTFYDIKTDIPDRKQIIKQIYYFFVYEAILTNNSSKCLYLRVLKTYIKSIKLLVKNGLSTNR